jgi:hypothetical protein
MTTTTHVSAGRRRRRRLRRTVLVAVLLVVAGGAAGYAAWHDQDAVAPPAAQATGGQGAGSAQRPSSSVTPRAAPTSTVGKSTGATRFAPVVTDRIPKPTTSIALTAPVPGTTNMQTSAARAFGRAFAAARADGLAPEVRSAWRSQEWQQVLFDRAVAKYGSAAEASKWVLSPVRSAHVKGYAIDVHPQAAATWLEAHGAAYGICRTYDNEWWHFEYLATSTCPPRTPTAAG